MKNINVKRNDRFGGLLYASDFDYGWQSHIDNKESGSLIAKRIAFDARFDFACKKNIERRKRIKKHMEDR